MPSQARTERHQHRLALVPTEHWDYRPFDVVRGLQAVLSSRHAGAGPDIDIAGLGRCLPIRSARAAIVLALQALALPRRASVGVPLYCCPVVFKAIEAAGCRARFIDVDPETYCLSATDLATKSSQVDVVLPVHMFGNLCDMAGLRRAAPGKPFIEDCAQALGSRHGGRLAGSFGEIAAFSFRSGKYLSVGEGGALYSSETHLGVRLSELVAELSVPTRTQECVHVASTYLRSVLRRRPLWGPLGTRLWNAYNRNVAYPSKSPLVLGQIYQTDLAMTVRRLHVLDTSIEKQRSNADYYSRNLMVDPEMLCFERPGAFYNRLQYPLLMPSAEQCDRMAALLLNDGVSTARPYKDIVEIAKAYYGYAGDCPRAESVAQRVLVIPCNHGLEAAAVERIARAVNRAWAQVRTGGHTSRLRSVCDATPATLEKRQRA